MKNFKPSLSSSLIAAFVALLVALTISHSTYADASKGERVVNRVTEKLNLSIDQQSLLRIYITEKQNLRKKHRLAKQERKANKNSFGDSSLFSSNNYLTVSEVNQMLDERHTKRKAARQEAIIAFVNFRNSLSPEQRVTGKKMLNRLFKMKSKRKKGKKKYQ